MRIIITGGAGFIGSAVARLAIQERNCDVLVVDKLTYAGNIENLRPVMSDGRFSFLQSDICDRVAMTNAMTSFAPDAVLHLAAESHVDRSIDGPADFIQTNVVGTFSMLEAARGYWSELPAERASRFRFIHISTDEVFGALERTVSSRRARPTRPVRHIQRPRPDRTIWLAHGATLMACRPSSPTVRTITGRITFLRN